MVRQEVFIGEGVSIRSITVYVADALAVNRALV